MWVAKNSITGKYYGKKYADIYDCQKFINEELFLLEYEFRRAFSMEEHILWKIENDGLSFYDMVHKATNLIMRDIRKHFRSIDIGSDECQRQFTIDEEKKRILQVYWQKNNIIRCWNISQKRYCDGFDF